MIGSQDHMNVWAVPQCNMTSYRNSFKVNSFEMIQFPNQPLKKINCAFDKLSLLLQTVLESEARGFLALFSWTSVGLSQCPIDKIIGWEGHLTVWKVTRVESVLTKNSINEFFLKEINLQVRHRKNVHCPLSCINLHSLTGSRSETSSVSPTVQLDFSWTLEMSYQ